jgi:hypothetical protein
MEHQKMEEMWELQKRLETISESISRQKFSEAIEKLEGRIHVRKSRSKVYSMGGKPRTITHSYRDYLLPLDCSYHLRIDRNENGLLSMWLYDSTNPQKLGISTLLAFEHQPIIARKLKFLIQYLS